MKIGVIVAMDKEFNQLKALGDINGKEIIVEKCGIGKVNSALGALEMIKQHKPDLIISSGCAGGADTSLNVGDVVVASSCVYHDAYCGENCEFGQILGMPARFDAPKEFVDKALSLNTVFAQQGSELKVKSGLTVSGEWFVDSQDKMRSIMEHFPEATAVDMESCSIAQTCYKYNVPFVSFRIISDVPLKDHKAQMYFDFWDRMADGSFEVTKD
ncbi:MAG: 5'-methylthioadenosine/S-adenosylhomocysteine nucleosidase, partial [Prevotella sp.]|nr:5'-methylthioadenosine/S-adenosylhomocysteine nucleosidase [Prevotella sp.]